MNFRNTPSSRTTSWGLVPRIWWVLGVLAFIGGTVVLSRQIKLVQVHAAPAPQFQTAPRRTLPVEAQYAPSAPMPAEVQMPVPVAPMRMLHTPMMSVGRYLLNPAHITHSYEANGARYVFFVGGSNIALNAQESRDFEMQTPLLPIPMSPVSAPVMPVPVAAPPLPPSPSN